MWTFKNKNVKLKFHFLFLQTRSKDAKLIVRKNEFQEKFVNAVKLRTKKFLKLALSVVHKNNTEYNAMSRNLSHRSILLSLLDADKEAAGSLDETD